MVFSSITFLLYFLPICLLLYYISPNKIKNVTLLISSIIFYAWGAPKFIFVILLTTFLDYFFVLQMWNSSKLNTKKAFLNLSLLINLGLLFYFKYYNFFLQNVDFFLQSMHFKGILYLKILLPIGISFYTFESVTYVVDVYKKVHPPLKNFWEYQLYIIFFPKLIAGPIVRYHDIADQINYRFDTDSINSRLVGFYRFVIGLTKKVWIANTMGQQADFVFNSNFANISTAQAWVGALAYTFQIYFDFSGYSDMAIGLAKMFGFIIPENFNSPYISKSITEFWRRWHISLGYWMKNYLYIPLGGNKVVGKQKLYFNLIFVFFMSGLWHGASWTFIIWGLYHGFFLVVERSFLQKIYNKLPAFLILILTFSIVLIGWVLFRIDNISNAILFYKTMFTPHSGLLVIDNNWFSITIWFAIVFSFFNFIPSINSITNKWLFNADWQNKKHILLFIFHFVFFVLCVAKISGNSFNPFIYFRF